jgi:peptidoglycan/LPS O-acetylase OafA/YrhL
MTTLAGPVAKNKSNSWIKGLDSIRFVLAFIVFLSHLKDPFHDLWIQSPHLALRLMGSLTGVLFSGVGSVMAFFIISGFVIHYPNKDRYPDTKSFLIRRWLRIGLPLLIIALIVGIFHQFSAIPIWSLYCELIYYTLYPVLIRIKLSWFHKFLLSFILSIVLMALCARNDWTSLVHHRNINYSGAYWQLGDLLTWVIGLPCWILGVILAQHIDADAKEISAIRAWTFRCGVLLAGIVLDVLKFHFFVSYLFSMNVFAILLFFWIRDEIQYFKNRQPMRLLEFSGRFSYSLYLTHNVFVFFIGMVFPLTVYSYFPVILLTLLSSYLYYLLVERPCHLLSRRLARPTGARNLAINYK